MSDKWIILIWGILIAILILPSILIPGMAERFALNYMGIYYQSP